MGIASDATSLSRVRLWAFHTGLFFLWLFLRCCYRLRVEGAENVPPRGACIVYANHAHWLDIPVVGVSVPRVVRFLAKRELFRVPVLGPAIHFMGSIPVNRGYPDKAAIRQSLDVLAKGDVLGIFPEGTRGKEGRLLKPEPGLAYLAYKSGAPVVPVAISSSYRWFAPILVRIGRPIAAGAVMATRPNSEGLSVAAERLMEAVAALLDPAVSGRDRISGASRPG